jgi:hypothetical protein
MNLSGLIPEARPIVAQAAAVYLAHFEPWFVGLLAHGSAVKGGIIPGCSDIDLQLYLTRDAFSWHGHIPLNRALAVRRALTGPQPEGFELDPFRYIQCYPRPCVPEPGWVGPIPGAYHVIAGRLPVPEATAAELVAAAQRDLANLDPAPTFLVSTLLGPGGVRLARRLRRLCTIVWPILYQVLTLQEDDPIKVWNLPKAQAIEHLDRDTDLGHQIRRFYHAVQGYYPAENSLGAAESLVASGAAFLQAASGWWHRHGTASPFVTNS